MKRMTLAGATVLTIAALPAVARPDLVAKIPLSGGTAVYELYMDRALLPECQKAGSHPSGLVAKIETPKGVVPYGTGCWIARMDGNIWMAVKSFDDGLVRETVLHNSHFKKLGSEKTAASKTPPAPTRKPEKKKIYRVDMADTDVTLEDEPCKAGGKKAKFTHKLYDIGGYGCWVDAGQHILVHWTEKKTLSGNIEPFDSHSKISRPADMPLVAMSNASDQPTGNAKELIARVDKLAYTCSEGAGEAQRKACKQVEPAMKSVMKEGWCWGPDDVSGYEKRWIRCR